MEIDEVVVNKGLWARCKAGDDIARKELGMQLKGLELYFHIMQWDPSKEQIITLRELEAANVVDYVIVGGQHVPGIVEMTREDGSKVQVHVRDNGDRG